MKNDALAKKLDNLIFGLLVILAFIIPFSKAAIEVIATLAIVLWIAKLIISRQLSRSALFWPLMLFTAANFLSALFSRNVGYSLGSFLSKSLEYLLIAFIALDTIRTRRRVRFLLGALFLSALIVSLDGLWQFKTGYDLFRHRRLEAARVTSVFVNPNDLGAYLAAVLPFLAASCMAQFTMSRLKLRYFRATGLTLIAFFIIAVLFFANSKGAYLGLLSALALMLGLTRNRKILISALAAVSIVVLLFIGNSNKPFLGPGQLNDRLKIWQGAIQMIVDRPFFGQGLNTFMGVYGHNYFAGAHTEQRFTYAHNCLLQLTAETGLVGFFSFGWLIISLYHILIGPIWERRDKFTYFTLLGFTGAITASLIHSLFDTNLYALQLAVLFWLIAGSAVGFAEGTKNEIQS